MLRRWRSRLHARLGDKGASVCLLQRDARGMQQVVFVHDETLAAPSANVNEVVVALGRALRAASEAGHTIAGLRCDVSVADAWMAYDVIECDLEAMPRRAADDLVRTALADTAGLRAEEIAVRWQRQGEGRCFAGGLPVTTLQALQGVVKQCEVLLGTVNGELVLAYNARRHDLEPRRSVLAVARDSGTQLALLADGGFAATRFEAGTCEPATLFERSRALMRCAGFEPDDSTRYYADESLPEDAETPWSRQVPPRHLPWRLGDKESMAPLDFDLSPTRSRVRPASWLLLTVGVAAVTVAAVQFQTANGQQLHEARTLRALEVSLDEARTGGKTKALATDAHGVRATAAVVRELQVPWAKFFAALEAVANQQVALLSVEPSAIRQEVRLVAEAKSSASMLDFLEALRAQSLREVVLVSHQVQSQTPGAPIRFQARAVWDSQ